MNLEKYTGQVSEGEFTARITAVEAGKAKDDSDKLVFHADFPELELTNRIWSRSLKPTALSMLRDDLAAAEALREGESYPDNPAELARIIQEDLQGVRVRVRVKPSKTEGFQDFKIVGLDLAAA